MKTRSYIYIPDRFIEVNLSFEELIRLWERRPIEPLEVIRTVVEREVGVIKSIKKHAPYFIPHEGIITIEYIVEVNEGEASVKIVCAEDPHKALMKYHEAKKKGDVKLREINSEDYVRMVTSIIRGNYYNRLGIREVEEALSETIKLANDIIDYWGEVPHENFTDLAVRSTFLFSLLHIIWPSTNGIALDLLLGNLPACFMQLRLIVETMAKSLATDYTYEFKGISVYNSESLERYLKSEKVSTSRFLRKMLSEVMGRDAAEETLKLWGKLSEDWAHFRGIVRRIKESLEKERFPPSYHLALPIELDEEVREDLEELVKRVKNTRELLKIFFERWKQLVKSYY